MGGWEASRLGFLSIAAYHWRPELAPLPALTFFQVMPQSVDFHVPSYWACTYTSLGLHHVDPDGDRAVDKSPVIFIVGGVTFFHVPGVCEVGQPLAVTMLAEPPAPPEPDPAPPLDIVPPVPPGFWVPPVPWQRVLPPYRRCPRSRFRWRRVTFRCLPSTERCSRRPQSPRRCRHRLQGPRQRCIQRQRR